MRARLGLQARIAIAGTIGAAHALAQHERNRVTFVNLYGEPDAMAPLAIAALRVEPYQRDGARRLSIPSAVGGCAFMEDDEKSPASEKP
ncbi:MAG: polymerase family protein [Sphingomonas bacterium]|nr:polymerase family protein [Sphingomonas bacterium]